MAQKQNRFVFLGRASEWLLLFGINSGIAVLLHLAAGFPLLHSFINSQFIGFSIGGLVAILTHVAKRDEPNFWIFLIAISVGVAFGGFMGDLIAEWLGVAIHASFSHDISWIARSIAIAAIMGIAVSLFFYQKMKREQAENAWLKQDLLAQDLQRNIAQTELKMLQAQIEPHFLFNTLSNIDALIVTKPDQAQQMLNALSGYLRVGLRRTRAQLATVENELELLNNYLKIQKIRMDDRFEYTLEGGMTLNDYHLPPLLIQPLVENAIKHGIEKNLQGGKLEIVFARAADQLKIRVSDNGPGMSPDHQGNGIGLINVQQRLKQLYGERAALHIKSSQQGTTIEVELPATRDEEKA